MMHYPITPPGAHNPAAVLAECPSPGLGSRHNLFAFFDKLYAAAGPLVGHPEPHGLTSMYQEYIKWLMQNKNIPLIIMLFPVG